MTKRSYLRYGDISINLKGHEVYFKDIHLSFTPLEFDIIELLGLHPGQVFSKEQIYEKVWGYDADGDSAGVAEHIKNIRNKLNKADPEEEFISTVWGVGYKWEMQKRKEE